MNSYYILIHFSGDPTTLLFTVPGYYFSQCTKCINLHSKIGVSFLILLTRKNSGGHQAKRRKEEKT